MQGDISRQILKWKVLDRWENEGGRLSDDWIENRSAQLTGTVQSEAAVHEHPKVDEQARRNTGPVRGVELFRRAR